MCALYSVPFHYTSVHGIIHHIIQMQLGDGILNGKQLLYDLMNSNDVKTEIQNSTLTAYQKMIQQDNTKLLLECRNTKHQWNTCRDIVLHNRDWEKPA